MSPASPSRALGPALWPYTGAPHPGKAPAVRRFPLLLCTCLPVLLGTACFKRDFRTVQLRHEPAAGAGRIKEAEGLNVVLQVNDLRPPYEAVNGPLRDRVGNSETMLGKTIDPTFLLTRPLEDLVKDALRGELEARGFSVRGGPGRELVVNVQRLFTTSSFSFLVESQLAHVDLEVLVRREGREVFRQTLHAQGEAKLSLLPKHEVSAEKALNLAYNQAFAALFGNPEFLQGLLDRQAKPLRTEY